jgi:hypothetical protein
MQDTFHVHYLNQNNRTFLPLPNESPSQHKISRFSLVPSGECRVPCYEVLFRKGMGELKKQRRLFFIVRPTNVGFEFFTAVVMKSIIFWNMTSCSPLSLNRRFGGTYRLHIQGGRNRFSKPACHLLARWFVEPISSTLKMDTICSSETSVETQRTTRRHIPEDYTLHNHRCENLKSYNQRRRSILL